MKQSFKRIAPHLYKRQYQAANGEWTTLHYGIFVDWKGKRRTLPLGSDLKTAKQELKVLEARNIRKEDFDKDKLSSAQGVTFSEWGNLYFKEKVDPDKRSVERERRSFTKLKEFFGNLPLVEINRSKVMEYKARRSQEPIIRKGKPVEGSKIAFSTVNKDPIMKGCPLPIGSLILPLVEVWRYALEGLLHFLPPFLLLTPLFDKNSSTALRTSSDMETPSSTDMCRSCLWISSSR